MLCQDGQKQNDRAQALLKDLPIFNQLTQEEASRLSNSMKEVKVSSGDTLIWQGEPQVDCMYLIESGQFECTKQDGNGDTYITKRYSVGEYFGEYELLNNLPKRVASFMAVNDSVLWKIEG